MSSGVAVQTNGLGSLFVLLHVGINGGPQLFETGEAVSPDGFARDAGKEPFHQVGPRAFPWG
jgi:hypothetical protein